MCSQVYLTSASGRGTEAKGHSKETYTSCCVKKFPHYAQMSLTQFSSTVTTKYSPTILSFRSSCINWDECTFGDNFVPLLNVTIILNFQKSLKVCVP